MSLRTEQKSAMRSGARVALGRLSPEVRAAASASLCAICLLRPEWRQAQTILLYASLPDEVDVWPVLQQGLASGKTVALPRYSVQTKAYGAAAICNPEADIQPGKLGIREPKSDCAAIPLNRLDLVLVPGVAFDLHGRRLGRGKGFYDRLLADVRGVKCGVAFDEQIVPEVPVGPHDAPLDCIVTPTRWLEC
jgi:5-formyltetrahydrofolate cyclo-ligase